MKLDTPRRPRKKRGFPTLEKGGVFVRRGLPQKAGLAYAPLGTGLADRDALAFVEGVGYATRFGKVTAARITLDPVLLGTRLDSFITER